jgi:hypothetical protein
MGTWAHAHYVVSHINSVVVKFPADLLQGHKLQYRAISDLRPPINAPVHCHNTSGSSREPVGATHLHVRSQRNWHKEMKFLVVGVVVAHDRLSTSSNY